MPQTRFLHVSAGRLRGMTKTPLEHKRCQRGCCWNPFTVCGLTYACRCHAEPIGNLSARIRWEDFVDSLGDDE